MSVVLESVIVFVGVFVHSFWILPLLSYVSVWPIPGHRTSESYWIECGMFLVKRSTIKQLNLIFSCLCCRSSVSPSSLFYTLLYSALCPGNLRSMGLIKGLLCSVALCWVKRVGSNSRSIRRKEKRLGYLFFRFPSCWVPEYWLHPIERF